MKQFIRSFFFAFSGIAQICRKERNFQVQLCIAIVVLFASWFFKLSNTEWILIIICCSLVLSLEMINTAIEKLCDVVEANFHPGIKMIKDISAGAVLLAAVTSFVIGLIIFIPKILSH